MPFKSEAQRRWMYANEPAMAKRWQKHTPKGKELPTRVSKKAALLAASKLLVKKAATTSRLQRMDRRGIGPDALQALLSGDFRAAMEKAPLLNKYKFEKEDRKRRLKEELRNPGQHLEIKEPAEPQGPADPGNPLGNFAPTAPGVPMPPSNLLGMFGGQGMTQAAGLRDYFMTKLANGDTAETESKEDMSPNIVQQLVNFIASKGQSIDDNDFHAEAEGLGVDPHEAEEEVYRLLAALVGGKNDIVRGGKASGMPTEEFPKDQIAAGREVEKEHTPNPAIATEIAKDHLTEVDDYYKPRLADMEDQMKKDKEEGEVKGVSAEKKSAFKYGFLRKVAESGLKPSEVMGILKSATGSAGSEFVRGLRDLVVGALKLGVVVPPAILALAAGGGTMAAYQLSKEPEIDPEEIHHMERVVLHKRLARQAKQRAMKKQPTSLGTVTGETQPDDAHKKILPVSSGGVEI